MQVKDLMTTSLTCVQPHTTLPQIARQMRQEDIGLLPVCSDTGRVLGVITDRDLVLRGLTQSPKSAEKNSPPQARDLMSGNVISATPELSIHHAALLMAAHQIRRLPVMRNQKLVGMLSISDIARKAAYIDEAGDALSAISTATPLIAQDRESEIGTPH